MYASQNNNRWLRYRVIPNKRRTSIPDAAPGKSAEGASSLPGNGAAAARWFPQFTQRPATPPIRYLLALSI